MINKINTFSNYNLIEKQKSNKIEKKELSRVEELKKAIENGSYKIDIKKTAKIMAEKLLEGEKC